MTSTANVTIDRLERRLADYVGRSYCVCVGSGTAALTVALRALALPRGSEVIVPAICCEAVPFAVSYAGLTPVYCDVEVSDYNMSPDSLARVTSGRTRAVIPVHLFGYPAHLDEIVEHAGAHGLVVVEDAAQAFGGSYRDHKLGSFGELSVTSFGYAKIIDIGSGGAVFTDDSELHNTLRKLASELPAYDGPLPSLAKKWYGRLESPKEDGSKLRPLRRLRRPLAAALFHRSSFRTLQSAWAQEVWTRLHTLDEEVAIRRANALMYRELIRTDAVTHPDYAEHDGACFRYTVLVRRERARLHADLARAGEGVTRLYPALPEIHGASSPARDGELRRAEFIAPRLMNFEVKPDYPRDRIARLAQLVNDLA